MIRGADGDGRGNFEGRLMMTGSSPLYRPLFATLALAVACSVGSPLLAEQEPASEETGQTKEEKAAAEETSKNEYSEEIFVKGSAGTSALSSSVATKMDVPLRLTPASVSVVTRALSEEQNAVTVSDALRNTSGVNVQSNFGQHDFFIVRGFDSLAGGLVLTDGLAEPEATFYHLYNVERVEVLKGPGGFLYGTNASAGTVNLLRLKPAKDAFWGAEVGGGSFDTYDAAFDANFGGDVVRFRLNGLWRESDGYRDGRESQIAAVNPVLDFTVGNNSFLRFDAEGLRSDAAPDAGLPISGAESFDLPRKRSYQSPFDDSEQDVTRLRLHWESLLDGTWTIRNRAYWTELDWQSEGTLLNGVFPFFPGPDGLFVARTLVALDDDQTWYGDELEVQRGGENHNWLFGVEVAERNDEFAIVPGQLPFISLFNPVESATSRPDPLPGLSEAGDAQRQIIAPYVTDRWLLSEHWQVLWGARVDFLESDDDVTGASSDDEEISPFVGITWAPSTTLTGYLNAGRSVAPPSTRAGSLEPEQSEQLELGMKNVFFDGRMHLTVAAYQLERQDIAIFDDNGFTAQTGSQRSRGVEVELAGSIGDGFRYQIACARSASELTEFNELVFPPPFFQPTILDHSGNDPAFAPEDLWNFWVAKTFRGGFGLGGGGRLVGEQFIAEDNVFVIDQALTFDATAFYDFDEWKVALNVTNIGDEEYEKRGFSTTSIIPADGTAAMVTISYRK
jgi:iron complex outermembrane receptor protein